MFVQRITSASTSYLAIFSPVCVLMAVKKLSTCHHQNSENKIFIPTNVCRWEHSESTTTWAGFSPVCVLNVVTLKWHHIAIRKVTIRFSSRPMFVGWDHSKSTCSCAGVSPVCALMAVKNLSTYPNQNSGHEYFITNNHVCRTGTFRQHL